MLVSPDNTAMLMQVGFSETAFETKTMETVRAIRSHLDGPTGLEIYVSGQGGIAADFFESLTTSIERTTWITIALVIVLLLLIYRSPVASLVPLLTIGVAFLVARGVLGYLAQAGIELWSQIDAFLIVLIFGVGTDYCLFIVSRFREELKRSDDHFKANVVTMTKIGVVITASAAAVIIGLAGLGVGRLEMLRTMGPALGLAIFITLLTALTLTPALVSLFGRHLFWPLHNNLGGGKAKSPLIWANIARYTTRHPVVVTLVVVVVLLIPYAALPNSNLSFNILSELPKDMDSRAGFEVLEQHYDAGEMMPLTALIVPRSEVNITDHTSLAALATISDALRQVEGVQKVQSIVQPSGTGESPGEVTVSGQLKMLQDQIVSLTPESGNPAAFLGMDAGSTFNLLAQYLTELGQVFPWVQEESSYQAIGKTTQELSQALAQMNEATLVENQLRNLSTQVGANLW
jgi:RND superfamily putative drug exporter